VSILAEPLSSASFSLGRRYPVALLASVGPADGQAAAQEFPIGAGSGQPQGFPPGALGGGVSAEAEMELRDHRVPTGISGRNVLWNNGGQALEAGSRAVQVCFGDRAVERVQRRRRDAIERVVQRGDPPPIGVREGRRAAVLPGDAGFHVLARQLVAGG
jgi:hypothetical protein